MSGSELRSMLRRLTEAGARNSKKDGDRLAQIIVAAFENMNAAEQAAIMKQLRAKLEGDGGSK